MLWNPKGCPCGNALAPPGQFRPHDLTILSQAAVAEHVDNKTLSAVYSAAAWYDWWPRLPPGALHDTDLWAGFFGGAALLALLVLPKRSDSASLPHVE